LRRLLVGVCIVALLWSVGVACLAQDGYAQGYEDGRRAAEQDCNGLTHYVAGLALGVFYVGYALIAPPSPLPSGRMDEIQTKSDVYQEGYIAGYEAAMQGCRTSKALLGFGTWVIILYVISAAVQWP